MKTCHSAILFQGPCLAMHSAVLLLDSTALTPRPKFPMSCSLQMTKQGENSNESTPLPRGHTSSYFIPTVRADLGRRGLGWFSLCPFLKYTAQRVGVLLLTRGNLPRGARRSIPPGPEAVRPPHPAQRTGYQRRSAGSLKAGDNA